MRKSENMRFIEARPTARASRLARCNAYSRLWASMSRVSAVPSTPRMTTETMISASVKPARRERDEKSRIICNSSTGDDTERRTAERTAPVHRERFLQQRVAADARLRDDGDRNRRRLAGAGAAGRRQRDAANVGEIAERERLRCREHRRRKARERQRADEIRL